MKFPRTKLLFLFFLLTSSTFAGGFLGGEVGWTCLSNGKYIFYVVSYHNCSQVPSAYSPITLQIEGSPLPIDENGNSINAIVLQPDSAKWLAARNGDLTPLCNPNGASYSCLNSNGTSVQEFLYQSDTICLRGVPPWRRGWTFYYAPCCRPYNFYDNVDITGGTFNMPLKSVMYRNATLDSVNICFDSSPRFAETPDYLVCRGEYKRYSNTALDSDLDELRYRFNIPVGLPINNPSFVSYKAGYGAGSPTPNQNHGSNNLASTINWRTGQTQLAVRSGTGVGRYLQLVQVDAYREGVLISSVFREYPIIVTDCSSLPDSSSNTSPQIWLNGDTINIDTMVVAGQTLSIPVRVNDRDTSGGVQYIRVQGKGSFFAGNLSNSGVCPANRNRSTAPCAYLQNINPTLDSSLYPPQYTISGSGSVSSQFVWTTDCNHLSADSSAQVHYFYLTAQDDHCPFPQTTTRLIKVTVIPDTVVCRIVTRTNDFNDKGHIKLYPNPTTGKLKVELGSVHQQLELTVRNIHGQLVQQKTYLSSSQLDFDIQGKPGIYFLELINEQGETANWKVVKQ